MIEKIRPVVGYKGGKRRLLPRLRPYFPVSKIGHYVEPFVGMGALYLDLRVQGYAGPATLADENLCVALFWKCVHDNAMASELQKQCDKLGEIAASVDLYRERLATDVADPIQRVAIFLWLTNIAYGNAPPWYIGDGQGWHGKGTKLTSAAKWGKKFPWEACCDRLRRVCSVTVQRPCKVLGDGIPLLGDSALSESGTFIYADPPYYGSFGYRGKDMKEGVDYAQPVFQSNAPHIVLSETRDLRDQLPPGWLPDYGEVAARQSHSEGAIGLRNEWLYVLGQKPAVYNVFAL